MRDVNREDDDMDQVKLAQVLAEMREELGHDHLGEHELVLASLGEPLTGEFENHRQACLSCLRKISQLAAGTRALDFDDLAARIRGYPSQPAEILLSANAGGVPPSPGEWSEYFEKKDRGFRYHYRRLSGRWYEIELNASDDATGERRFTLRVHGESCAGRWTGAGRKDAGWSGLWAKIQIELPADPTLAEIDLAAEENHE